MRTYLTVAIPYVNADPHLGYASSSSRPTWRLVPDDRSASPSASSAAPTSTRSRTSCRRAADETTSGLRGSSRRRVRRHSPNRSGSPSTTSSAPDATPATVPRSNGSGGRAPRSGDCYRRDYRGRTASGCEQFYEPKSSSTAAAPNTPPVDTVAETNWFFRLSRYADRLIELIEPASSHPPAPFRAEILAFVRRRAERHQRVAFDRTGPWLGDPRARRPDPSDLRLVRRPHELHQRPRLRRTRRCDVRRWWRGRRRAHPRRRQGHHPLPRRLLAGVLAVCRRAAPDTHPCPPLPHHRRRQALQVLRRRASPTELTKRYGTDALRWWIPSDVNATSDTDFTVNRLVTKANETLANGLGNAVNRVTTLRHRYQNPAGSTLQSRSTGTATGLQADVATALANFDRRGATDLITRALAELNQRIEADRPWKLAGHPDTIQQLTELLDGYVETLRHIARALTPSRQHSPGSPSINSTPIPQPTPRGVRTSRHHRRGSPLVAAVDVPDGLHGVDDGDRRVGPIQTGATL